MAAVVAHDPVHGAVTAPAQSLVPSPDRGPSLRGVTDLRLGDAPVQGQERTSVAVDPGPRTAEMETMRTSADQLQGPGEKAKFKKTQSIC